MKNFLLIIFIISVFIPLAAGADTLGARLKGKILLQVERNGEAWYVNPGDEIRYFLGRPTDAFSLMRDLGLGIKHSELENYLKSGFPERLSGKIMLDVEENGEAYYVYPGDFKGYFLGRPADAFTVMRNLGLGITNTDLEKINSGSPGIDTEEGVEDTGVVPDMNTSSGSNFGFDALNNELDGIINGNLIVGGDHYERIKSDISNLETAGTDVALLTQKLLKIGPDSGLPNNTESGLENELDNIIRSGAPIASEHLNRIEDDILALENKGTDIAGLREKLETVKKLEYTTPTEIYEEKKNSLLPDCTGQKFTALPADLSEVVEIYPLGGLGPPGHTLPTEHMYIHINMGQTSTEIVPLYSPGEIYITYIGSSTDSLEPTRVEYRIDFALCRDVFGYFGHVKEISDELKSIDFETEVVHKIEAGVDIGRVGRKQGNFDFGAYDKRTKLGYINPDSYSRSRSSYIMCVSDLYDEPLRSQYLSKIKRTAEPKCGEVMQDIEGTLQGNWFYGGTGADGTWENHLAIVHDNHDPRISVISIGGTIMEPAKWEFTARPSGFISREFKDVTPDGNIYCYDEGQPGRILVEMISDISIEIEHQDGGCTGGYVFNNPIIYNR